MVKVATVSTVRAPLAELEKFVNYHQRIGIDEVILFFDDPLDPAIERFHDRKGVTAIPCTREYWDEKGGLPDYMEKKQVINANVAVGIAKERGCTWISHIDSDELIYPLKDIRETLENAEADALRFAVREAVSQKEQYENIYEPTLFKVPSSKERIEEAILRGCNSLKLGRLYFRGHIDSKWAIRICDKIELLGIHFPLKCDLSIKIANAKQLCLLHYYCVGYEDWEKKWSRRLKGPCVLKNPGPKGERQLKAYAAAKNKGQEALRHLYRSLHVIPPQEIEILLEMGMMEEHLLNPNEFDIPTD